jgi:hypothetical protein
VRNAMQAISTITSPSPITETTIYYSTSNLLRWLASLLFIEWLALYGLLAVRPLSAGAVFSFFIALGCPVAIGHQLWLLVTHPLQLMLSARGIQRRHAAVDLWSSIEGEKVKLAKFSRGREWYLCYQVGTTSYQVSIRKLAIQPTYLTHLLQHYRAQAAKTGA